MSVIYSLIKGICRLALMDKNRHIQYIINWVITHVDSSVSAVSNKNEYLSNPILFGYYTIRERDRSYL